MSGPLTGLVTKRRRNPKCHVTSYKGRAWWGQGQRVVSGPSRMDGGHLADVTAELGLGVLTGRERAWAVAHLEKCEACRIQVQDMTVIGEQLAGLLPGRQPPAGFAVRATRRLGYMRRRQTRRMLAIAAGTVIAVAGGLAGWGLRTTPIPSGSRTGSDALTSAILTTAGHQAIGKVFLYGGSQQWLYMTVDIGGGNTTVVCQLQSRDGLTITVGSFQLASGRGDWGSPEPDQPGAITSARLTTTTGVIVATASFHGAR